jgi:alkylation response protein AidB-like acyl-CoA dehydrogenase
MDHQRDEHPMLCAFAITEPGGGSDVEEAEGLATGDIRTYARKVDGGYRITGRKVFISNGREAEYTVVYAALDRADPASSWTSFVVRRGSPGFRCARVERKMGQRACPAAELEFDDVFVPSDMLLGEEGGAWDSTRQVLAISRGPVGSIATGIARDACEASVEYLTQGAPGCGAPRVEPWMEDRVAAMTVRVRTARAAYLEAAVHCDEVLLPPALVQEVAGRLGRFGAVRKLLPKLTGVMLGGKEEAWAHQAVLGATAKVAGSDAAMWATSAALDIIPVWAGRLRKRAEKAFRDAKLTQIYEGTNQINLRSIAHETWRRSASPGSGKPGASE